MSGTISSKANEAVVDSAARIGVEVAAPVAREVDLSSRFPVEAIRALRNDRQLSLLVPERLGGGGSDISTIASATCALARHCSSTAMIYAMHHLAVACLVRHGKSDFVDSYLRELVEHQFLLASATTEAGTGGDLGSSVCAVKREGGRFQLHKQAPVVSYGDYADAVLATARRRPDSPPNDQVLVLCSQPQLELEAVSGWDALGFRGTCSAGFALHAEGDEAAVLPDGFDVISAETNLPVSHVLWSHVWLGIAGSAVDLARAYVQSEARKKPGFTPASAMRLAELDTRYREMTSTVRGAARHFDEISEDREALETLDYTIEMNALKVSASTLVVDIVSKALTVCGMAGYREDSPFSMGRLLRDAHGAALMLNNDRLLSTNAQLLLVSRGPT